MDHHGARKKRLIKFWLWGDAAAQWALIVNVRLIQKKKKRLIGLAIMDRRRFFFISIELDLFYVTSILHN